jgi:exodeoxyribonuclease-3
LGVVIATFNAASVRARLPIVTEWLAEHEPDLLAIQETKVENDKFPIEAFEDLGYNLVLNGQKSWNGVATLTKAPVLNPVSGFVDDLFPEDARVLACDYHGITFINTYVPNGNTVGSEKWDYKMRWLERFRKMLSERYSPQQPLVWLGDINIAPTSDDVFDAPKMLGKGGHHPDEFARLDAIRDWGLTDLYRLHHQGPGDYTFWDFVIPRSVERNLGWRIDHIYATTSVAGKCSRCWIDIDPRKLERPSDHTFVLAELDW